MAVAMNTDTPGIVASHPVMIVCFWDVPAAGGGAIYRGQPVWRKRSTSYQGKRYNEITTVEGDQHDFIGVVQTTRTTKGMVTVGISGTFNVVFPGKRLQGGPTDTLVLLNQESNKTKDRRFLICN